MKILKKFIQKEIGIPLSMVIPSGIELFPLDVDDINKSYLVASEIAVNKPYLIQGHLNEFIATCPQNYFLTGHWGYGSNSYAFYYSRVDSWSGIGLRVPWGGIYMDDDEKARLIRQFLTRYFKFEQCIKKQVKTLIAIESMWEGMYGRILEDGRKYKYEGSLFHNPNFNEIIEKAELISNCE